MTCHVLCRGHANEELFQSRNEACVHICSIVGFQLDVIARGGKDNKVTTTESHQSRCAGLPGKESPGYVPLYLVPVGPEPPGVLAGSWTGEGDPDAATTGELHLGVKITFRLPFGQRGW